MTTRRAVLASLGGLCLPGGAVARPMGRQARIASTDWAAAESLLALGVEPVAVANTGLYRAWAAEPPLPPTVADLGLPEEPNLERLLGLRLDFLLISSWQTALRPRLAAIAPVRTFSVFESNRRPLGNALASMRTLAQDLGRDEAGAAFERRLDRASESCRQRLVPVQPRPILPAVLHLDPERHSIILYQLMLPRMAAGLLAGAALGLAATLFQHALHNPLAEPTTLGISAGAYLALTAVTLWAPWLLDAGREWVALPGAGLAMLAVFALSGWAASPAAMIVAGLIVSLLCGALAALFVLLNHDYLTEIFIWQSGSLAQLGWNTSLRLAVGLSVAAVAAAVLLRPLQVLELGAEGGRALGLPVVAIRWAALCLATVLSAIVVAGVGVLGFVGLAAPALARMIGARQLAHRLLAASAIGALLLTLADAAVILLPTAQQVPAGVATALLGAPLVLLLLPRLRTRPTAGNEMPPGGRPDWPPMLALLAVALVMLVAIGTLTLLSGHSEEAAAFGLRFDWPGSGLVLLRLPRVLAAAAAGAMLALAGALLQRWSGNPLASPEVLGISSGACLGVVGAMLLMPGFDAALTWGAALTGACAALAGLVLLGRSGHFAPDRALLAGAAISVFSSAAMALLMTKGDPRIGFLLSWMTGSTYRTTLAEAQLAAVIACCLLAISPALSRWLVILPCGEPVARSLGLPLSRARFLVLVTAGTATATATLIVGPLSFVGLLAPQFTRRLGFRRPVEHLIASAFIGAAIMMIADWLGRNLAYPWQIPAGLVATLIGGLSFAFMLAFWGKRSGPGQRHARGWRRMRLFLR